MGIGHSSMVKIDIWTYEKLNTRSTRELTLIFSLLIVRRFHEVNFAECFGLYLLWSVRKKGQKHWKIVKVICTYHRLNAIANPITHIRKELLQSCIVQRYPILLRCGLFTQWPTGHCSKASRKSPLCQMKALSFKGRHQMLSSFTIKCLYIIIQEYHLTVTTMKTHVFLLCVASKHFDWIMTDDFPCPTFAQAFRSDKNTGQIYSVWTDSLIGSTLSTSKNAEVDRFVGRF